MLNNDLNILYSGGSGGFYIFHWILLYKKHYAAFSQRQENELSSAALADLRIKFISQLTAEQKKQLTLSRNSYQNIKDPQWPDYDYYLNHYDQFDCSIQEELEESHNLWASPITVDGWIDYQYKYILYHQWHNLTKWKSHEFFPDNVETLNTTCSQRKHKIYFFSNEIERWKTYPGKRIVIYTDIASHLRLSLYKKAQWFVSPPYNTKQVIKNVLKNHGTRFHNDSVYDNLFPAFEYADHIVKLQDLIADPATALDIPPTNDHLIFRDHWKSLHPDQLLKKCKI